MSGRTTLVHKLLALRVVISRMQFQQCLDLASISSPTHGSVYSGYAHASAVIGHFIVNLIYMCSLREKKTYLLLS